MATVKEIQSRLAALGFYKGAIDGKFGPQSKAATVAFQKSKGLQPDGIVGQRTLAVLFPAPPPVAASGTTAFDAASARNLAKAHVLLQLVMNEARKEVEFRVLDATRGKAAQEKAYREGNSKAKYGQSAHNYLPAVAVDIFPAPYDWNKLDAFRNAAAVIMRIAKARGVPLRWGGDWNMDGDKTKTDAWDMPHFELHPWRTYAAKAELVP